MQALRRAVAPLRDELVLLLREPPRYFSAATTPYLRDLYDHTLHAIDTVETYRDMTSGLQELYLSTLSNKSNDVMKVLTIIATIFIPLTFIVGIYGMNFDNMPELHWQWGYFAVLGFMGRVSLGMLWFFRKKKWL